MTVRYMQRFFEPRSIAVIGASERQNSLGGVVLENLLASGFKGRLFAVNPKGGPAVFGTACFPDVESLDETPDLAIVCTSPRRIPAIVAELGRNGVRAVMILMGGLSTPTHTRTGLVRQALELSYDLLGLALDGGKTLKDATWEAAQPFDMRIMGPNCMGTIVPRHRLNASYAHIMVPDGNVAYVGQSGVLSLAIMDWALGRGLGFSCLTSVGDSLDVDIADVLEYLADDMQTRAILLHVEEVQSGRRFVSALRAAARSKLVVVMKSRRVDESGTQPGPALLDSDVVYDAVFQRAGVLRVNRSDELFNALETLTRMRRLFGDRLAIVCNGIGPALLAVDRLILSGGKLAPFSAETQAALAEKLPIPASVHNPVDISAAATPEQFLAVLELLHADPETDAILLLHVPTRIAPPLETAEAVVPQIRTMVKPVLTCWIGRETAQAARTACDEADVSTFDSPEQAVDAFMHMAEYRRNQDLLDQNARSPDGLEIGEADKRSIWALIGQAKSDDREQLTPSESLDVIAAAGIDVDRGKRSEAELAVASLRTVIGVTRSPVFGPLLYLGTGEDSASAFSQRRVGLPPLNLNLAHMLLASTAIGSEIDDLTSDPQAIRDSLAEILVRLGQLIIEAPAIAELSMTPLIAGRVSAPVAHATITLGPRRETAITPYPEELEETVRLPRSGREIVLRPIRGEDAPAHAAFALRQSPESIRYRFFGPRSRFTQHELAQFTQIDYAREMAFIATSGDADSESETLGVVRAWTDPDNISAEFAVIVDESMRGEGLGQALLRKIIEYARQRGTLEIRGTVLSDNTPMRKLAKKLGFRSHYSPAEQAHVLSLPLNEPTDAWQRERLAEYQEGETPG